MSLWRTCKNNEVVRSCTHANDRNKNIMQWIRNDNNWWKKNTATAIFETGGFDNMDSAVIISSVSKAVQIYHLYIENLWLRDRFCKNVLSFGYELKLHPVVSSSLMGRNNEGTLSQPLQVTLEQGVVPVSPLSKGYLLKAINAEFIRN